MIFVFGFLPGAEEMTAYGGEQRREARVTGVPQSHICHSQVAGLEFANGGRRSKIRGL